MKNKKALLYLLGFLVVCIWGIILRRVYAVVGEDTAPMAAPGKQDSTARTYIPVLQPDTFQLQAGYSNPFDERGSVVNEPVADAAPVATGNVQMARPMAVSQPVNPVNVKYLGYVWNAGNKKKVAIINQNGKEMMMEEGSLADQLQLISITSDSVKVKFKGKTSFISINK